MIELPEAVTVARQIDKGLRGKGIHVALRGNSPHKFAFYSGEPEFYSSTLEGKTIGGARPFGGLILVAAEPGYTVVLGGGGERIRFHQVSETPPGKHQLLLGFADGSHLSVTVSGWGSCLLIPTADLAAHPLVGPDRPSPLEPAFSFERFMASLEAVEAGDPRSVKYAVISKPGVLGVGNGYLQDILFRARLHPRRRATSLGESERRALYDSIVGVMREAIDKGGRDDERDLFGQPGHYRRLLDGRSVGKPCPACGAAIEKISFLGGACYLCARCQT